MSGPSIVVLGGGLAGVAAAKRLGEHGLPVVLVDHHDYHQFQPMLYQVATAQLPAEDIARPLRTIFAEHPSVEVVTAHVETAKLSDRSLTFADGQTRGGDFLVVAAGARPNFFGIPGAAQHAYPLYSVADAERLRLHLQDVLRAAVGDGSGTDPADARAPWTSSWSVPGPPASRPPALPRSCCARSRARGICGAPHRSCWSTAARRCFRVLAEGARLRATRS